ncbi:MAG: TAXI family TRAP transporter solute-binding subunit [Mesorhizobium sp.]|nr:TAXI family TRAP transporter solute-binding subunit [Mesorhizobium sp.]
MIRKSTLFAAAAVVALSTAGQALAQDKFIRIGSGAAGTYPIFAAKLAELINENIEGYQASTVAGETEENLVRLHRDEIQTSITYTFFSRMVSDGNGQLGVPTDNVRHLITLYGSVFMPVARNDSHVQALSDVGEAASRVWVGVRSTIFYPMVLAALQAHGVTLDSITAAGGITDATGYGEQTDLMRDGQLDVGFFAGPIPFGPLMDLDQSPGFRLLGFEDTAMEAMMEALPGIGRGTHPGGIYNHNDDEIQVPYVVNHLLVNADMDEELAYQITKVIAENYEEFHGLFAGSEEIDANDPLANNAVPVHPGAERYYREAGLIE